MLAVQAPVPVPARIHGAACILRLLGIWRCRYGRWRDVNRAIGGIMVPSLLIRRLPIPCTDFLFFSEGVYPRDFLSWRAMDAFLVPYSYLESVCIEAYVQSGRFEVNMTGYNTLTDIVLRQGGSFAVSHRGCLTDPRTGSLPPLWAETVAVLLRHPMAQDC